MNSILECDDVLRVEKLHLAYKLSSYTQNTLRDIFVRLCSNPYGYFFKKRRRHSVLNGVEFNIKSGERVGLLGSNGAGKTSLCRCIAEMIEPESGVIRGPKVVRSIYSTSFGIMPELTGRENAKLLATLFFPELSTSERGEVVKEALDFSELKDFCDVEMRNYSRGMQARLFLSLVSSCPADLLILDEVFSGADFFFQEKISIRIKKLMENSGAVLFVSHSIDEIKDNCNRVLILHDGKIIYDGETQKGIDLYTSIKG